MGQASKLQPDVRAPQFDPAATSKTSALDHFPNIGLQETTEPRDGQHNAQYPPKNLPMPRSPWPRTAHVGNEEMWAIIMKK